MRRAALLVLLLLLVAGTAGATVRILPLGDSMTKGSTQTQAEASHPTYRYWLWHQLQGRDVDFVGSWTAPNFPYDFDQDNEGHGGYMTGGILNGVADDPGQGKLSAWLTKYDFDVALVMLGTNDVLNAVPTAESVRNLEGIIAQLRAKNPSAVILLAKIPPTSFPRPGIEALNAAIPGIAARTSTAQSPVVVVDMYTGYDGVADNQAPLGIHPAESGEKKIAARWYAALQPYLGAGPTPSATPSATPTPTSSPTATPLPVTPGTAAPNVIRSPGAVVYTGESGLDVTAAGIGAGDTLGWFANGPGGGAAPVATLRIADPKHAAIPHDTRTGAWYNMDRGRALALTVEEPAISLRLIDVETGRYVSGGETAKGRRFDLEVSGSLSAFAARETGAPVAVRIRDPAGRTVSTLIGDGGSRINLDRLMITSSPFRVRGTNGAAWNTGDPAYGAGAYELWAEGLFDHEHGTASPDPSEAVGAQVSAPVQLAVAAAPVTTPATSAPVTSAPTTPVSTTGSPTAVTTAPLTTIITAPIVATATATTVLPATTTIAPTPPSGTTSWWFPYFLGALALLLLVAGAGVWWALRSPGSADVTKPQPPGGARKIPMAKADRQSPPARQIALDQVQAWDPGRGRVGALETALRGLEQAEQKRTGSKAVDLLKLVPPAQIPSRPMPEPVRRWGARVGFVPLSIDRYGDVLFYSPTLHQGGTRLVVKRADDLLDRLGSDGELRR
jgi:lysophospholipase L1-like esterase